MRARRLAVLFALACATGCATLLGIEDHGPPVDATDSGDTVDASEASADGAGDAGRLAVSAPPTVVAVQGGGATVPVTITRGAAFAGAVQISLAGLPSGVTVTPPLALVAATDSQTSISLAVAPTVPQGPLDVTVTAAATTGSDSSSTHFTLDVHGPPGSLDTTFGDGGLLQVFVNGGGVVIITGTPAGKVIMAGLAHLGPGVDGFVVARAFADGAMDPTFGDGGVATWGTTGLPIAEGIARGVVPYGNGGAVTAGSLSGPYMNGAGEVTRWTTDGTLDTSFADSGVLFSTDVLQHASQVSVDADGRLIITGDCVARLLSDGRFDTTFGDAGVVTVTANGSTVYRPPTTVSGSDVIIGAGQSQAGSPRVVLARIAPDGSMKPDDSSLVYGVSDVFDLLADPAGRVLFAGSSASDAGGAIAVGRATVSNGADFSFGKFGAGTATVPATDYAYPSAVGIQSDGKVIVSGSIASPSDPNTYDGIVARFSADGLLDTTFGDAGVVRYTPAITGAAVGGIARGFVFMPDGRIIVGVVLASHLALARFWP